MLRSELKVWLTLSWKMVDSELRDEQRIVDFELKS